MLKLYKQERVSLEFLDDQILGIIVGVNNVNLYRESDNLSRKLWFLG